MTGVEKLVDGSRFARLADPMQLIDAAALAALPTGAFVINVARAR